MKKAFIFLIFSILLIGISFSSAADSSANENITVNEIDSDNIGVMCDNLTSKITYPDGSDSNLTIRETSAQPILSNDNASSNSNFKILASDLVEYYKGSSQFRFKVLDNDNPVSNAGVTLKVNGATYSEATGGDGVGSLTLYLKPGKYTITTYYNNISKTNTINVLSRLIAKDISSTYGKQVKFSVKVVDKNGNAMKKQLVKFKVSKKSYKAYTNSKGIASIKLNFKAGTYKITYSSNGFSGKSTYKVRNYYKITTYKWKSGADVTRNDLIRDNVPDSYLVKKIIKAAKKGTPVIKFKGGKGKSVFITSGVHGNELSSQIASMKLIKYFEDHPVKGTVYIMPFMNPKGTAENVRDYAGIHLNRKADVKGTISYKTIKLITKFKCSAYGDFHCTKPGGVPGKDVAMGSYKPTAKSAKIAKYIAKRSKVKYLIYNKAGAEYPGALEDVANLKHVPAVTCEVVTPHGTVAEGSVSKSLSMMKSLLKYNRLI